MINKTISSYSVLPEVVISDLDGTLLHLSHGISDDDFAMLIQLGSVGVIRVIATGRNLYSAKKIIDDNFPCDYLIFSSGCGILRMSDNKILLSYKLTSEQVNHCLKWLERAGEDYMLQLPIPNNHHLRYRHFGSPDKDFVKRLEIYKDFVQPLDGENFAEEASQFVVILSVPFQHFYDKWEKELSNYSVVRTTSPLNGSTAWMEIFPERVSKSQAAQWLCEMLSLNHKKTLALGNDYNDIDLLRWAKVAVVTSQAPNELKSEFLVNYSGSILSQSLEMYDDFIV